MKFWPTGGCVRDIIRGVPIERIKDVDVALEMEEDDHGDIRAPIAVLWLASEILESHGFTIHKVHEDTFTIRAGVPEGHYLAQWSRNADFNLTRREGPYSNGRKPDFVELGDLDDDLRRRDLTMNAIVMHPETRVLYDPHNGVPDIHKKIIRFVGDPFDRIIEDPSRILRALRFSLVLGFKLEPHSLHAVRSYAAAQRMADRTPVDTKEKELRRMFSADPIGAIGMLSSMPLHFLEALFEGGVWLDPTHKKRPHGSNRDVIETRILWPMPWIEWRSS